MAIKYYFFSLRFDITDQLDCPSRRYAAHYNNNNTILNYRPFPGWYNNVGYSI